MNTLKNYSRITLFLILWLGSYAVGTANVITVSSVAALQSASNSASAGDTIKLANGTYLNNSLTLSTSNITVMPVTNGGVYLNGTNAITISGNYITFSGFQFTSGSIAGFIIEVTGSHNLLTQLNFNGYSAQKYINLKNTGTYNEIAYCNFEAKPTTAPIGNLIHVSPHATNPGYHKIRYNSFQNMPGAGGDNGNECIRISNGATSTYISRTVVEFNFFKNTGMGDSEAISVKCTENVLRYNTFVDNPDAMMTFRNGNNNVAYGNFFIRSGGIRVKEANNIFCYNNYFENAGLGSMNAVTYIYISPNLSNINFIHNTFYECGMIDLASGATGNTWANNIFKKTTGNIFMGSPAGISWAGNIYDGTLGVTIASGMSNANPLLALNADGYRSITAASPAINSASTSYPSILDIASVDDDPTLLQDISNQSRPATVTQKDVGCDEYSTSSTANHPLSLYEVGPTYLIVPLPVTMTSFDVNAKNNKAIVNWSTSSEQNSSTFDVEKSQDGKHFVKIATVEAAHNSYVQVNYSYTDGSLNDGVTYYRLKQIDLNGKFEYSKIAKLNYTGSNVLKVYPSPASDKLNLQFETPPTPTSTVKIFNQSGQVVKEETFDMLKKLSSSALQCDISDLIEGIYIIQILDAESIQSLKFIIKR